MSGMSSPFQISAMTTIKLENTGSPLLISKSTTFTYLNSQESTKIQPDQKLFICDLPQDAKVRHIKHHFTKFGSIEKVEMTHINQFDKQYCFVVFKNTKSLKMASENKAPLIATKNPNGHSKIDIISKILSPYLV